MMVEAIVCRVVNASNIADNVKGIDDGLVTRAHNHRVAVSVSIQ